MTLYTHLHTTAQNSLFKIMIHPTIVVTFMITFVAITAFNVAGCATQDPSIQDDRHQSSLSHWLSDDLSKDVILAVIANTPLVVVVNLESNRSTIIKDRVVIDAWNSATADVSGEWHMRNNIPVSQTTPAGIYSLHDIEHCPQWFPRIPEGLVVTGNKEQDQKQRAKIFRMRSDLYGACGVNNPLGEYALWFYESFGYHGTTRDLEYILNLPSNQRRVSGGCIRNPPSKIEKIYSLILNELPDGQSYFHKVQLNRKLLIPKTLVRNISTDYRVVFIVGRFKRDLPFKLHEYTMDSVALDSVYNCTILHDKAPIYASQQFSQNEVVGYYQKGDQITPQNLLNSVKRNPVQTSKGWISQYYVSGSCVPGEYYWKKITSTQPYHSCDISGQFCTDSVLY